MRVGMTTFENKLDPANAYEAGAWNILNMTNDGLVGFKNVGGGDGVQIVPNLATSLPTSTDGGKTYSFRLRKGIRYSTGARVKASDVRATLERLFRAGTPTPGYFSGLRGGSTCPERPKTCDLSAGIVTDDEAGTVTFHLTAPDAEFLYKLATPFASILPAGTPISKGGAQPVPATGPYEIHRESATRLRLVRTGTSASGIRSRDRRRIRRDRRDARPGATGLPLTWLRVALTLRALSPSVRASPTSRPSIRPRCTRRRRQQPSSGT